MDIHETIRTARTLITQEKPDELHESLDALIDYTYMNVHELRKDVDLKQQIADCLQLGGKQVLALVPSCYEAYYISAISHFLNGNVNGLCQSMSAFFDEDAKTGGKQFTNEEFNYYIIFFSDNLDFQDKSQRVFLEAMTRCFEKNYPESAATYVLKSIDERIDREQKFLYLSKAIEQDKDFITAYIEIGYVYFFEKNWKNAISYFNKGVDLGVEGDILYSVLADCYGKIKDYGNEIGSYKKCLELNPKCQYAMNNLGYAYEKTNDYQQAMSCYEQSIKSGNDGVYPYRNTFRLLKKLKRYEDAIKFWEGNKAKLPKSFQKDVEKIRELATQSALQTQQQDVEDDIEDHANAEDAQPVSLPQPRSGAGAKSASGAFLAESRLEDEIVAQIEKGIPFANIPLRIYEGSGGYGKQYPFHGAGRIDILAVNTTNNDLYVIELKRGQGGDEVVDQISRYMGWVKKNLAADGQSVHGIICVAQATDDLKHAAAAHADISVFNYSFQVTPA